ncbi:MAG: hypothetical protein IPJ25_08630 [Rhodocyclaceae bacterium]|nr:hypothetical protein [Rhodocyclaceae bacterium]
MARCSITGFVLGTNDAAMITPAVDNLTESNVALTTGGTMVISDVDVSATTFTALTAVAGSNSHGTLHEHGRVWTHTANSAHDGVMAGSTYTDSVSVTSADGTVSSITVVTSWALTISPSSPRQSTSLTETNGTDGGTTMVISDIDSATTFTALTAVAGASPPLRHLQHEHGRVSWVPHRQ